MTLSSSECITWLAVFLTVSATIVTVNLLTIVLFIKNGSLRTRAMYLVINLTVADMFVGGFSNFYLFAGLDFICEIVKMNLSLHLVRIAEFLIYWPSLTSLTNIAAISFDRMYATICPFRYRVVKKWVYGVTIAGVWVLAAIISTASALLAEYWGKWSYHIYLWQSWCCLCLIVICVSYSSIAVKFLCGAHPQHHGAASRQRKLTVTLFIMTIVSLLMWLPHAAIAIFIHSSASSWMSRLSPEESFRLNYSLKVLFVMNSLVNPIVYAIRILEFRKVSLALLKCQQGRNANVFHLHAR
ncbi:unnamed protein product [Porites lobata]|uniref:G-protein coupled receptors family 1 profile domain-containing protein n=1 Tax=Porites lobata TaxID=104759 RepID=A0ABN8PHU7_9CNID|nr:unnamed protein product [Porites lobata]